MIKRLPLIILNLTLLLQACQQNKPTENVKHVVSTLSLNISYVAEYPHDTNAFTEGLLFHKGKLFESTGATDLPQTRSLFGDVNLETGQINTKVELDRDTYFGEGITFLHDRVYQLTYRSKIGFVYNATNYDLIDQFKLPGQEGWGLTTDGQNLIMSDGTNQLTYLHPDSLTVIKTLPVIQDGNERDQLNELEYVNGYIYANVWLTNNVIKIDPKNGQVIGQVDLTPYATDAKSSFPKAMEMNGIAYYPKHQSFFITGKLWPKIYEIRIAQ